MAGMSNDANSRVKPAIYNFFERRASSNPISLGEYLRELERGGLLAREEILEVADAITWAYEHGKLPT